VHRPGVELVTIHRKKSRLHGWLGKGG
jgi:hypothetical protein